MTKKILYGLTLVAAMASCTDDYTDWANPQAYSEESAKTIEMTVANASAINLANSAETVQLFVPTIAASESVVNNYTADLYAEPFVPGESDHVTLTTDSEGRVSATDLQQAVVSLFGARPEQRHIGIIVTCLTTVGSQSIKNVGRTYADVTPKAPFIDTAYYLTGDFAGWNKDGALAFNHIGSGDVYDNPEFDIVFSTTGDNQYWKIISGTNYNNDFWAEGETGVVGTVQDGDASMEGNLTTTSPQAGKIEEAGMYRMTINMMNYSYKIEKLNFAQYVYFIGATDGWNQSDQKLESPSFDGYYSGYVYIADPNGWGLEFKLQRVAGDWGDDSQLNSNNLNSVTGDIEKTGDNLKASAGEGVYYMTLDLTTNSLWAVKINNMNLVGDFNGWNAADDAQQMKWNADEYCYEITGASVTSNGWKFTTNNSWDINLGGTVDNLVANGDNLSVTGSTIKLYPTRKTSGHIYCTVE